MSTHIHRILPLFVFANAAACSTGAVTHADTSTGGAAGQTAVTSTGMEMGDAEATGVGTTVGTGGSSGVGGLAGSQSADAAGATTVGGTGGVAGPGEGGIDAAPEASVTTGDMRSGPFKMLVFSWTTGFHHDSIPAAQQMAKDLSVMGADNQIAPFTVDIANAQQVDPTGSCQDNGLNGQPQKPIPNCNASVSMFTDDNLKNYEIVFFANPTGDDFSRSGAVGVTAKAALEKWMNNGGAYIGTHSATDFEKGGNWTFYNDMLGALFDTHDGDGTQGTVVIQDLAVDHPVVRGLPKTYQTQDEWYHQLRNPEGRDGITILAKLASDQRPVVWVHDFKGGGRMVYTIRGHASSRFSEPWFKKLFLQGVMWAVHRLK